MGMIFQTYPSVPTNSSETCQYTREAGQGEQYGTDMGIYQNSPDEYQE